MVVKVLIKTYNARAFKAGVKTHAIQHHPDKNHVQKEEKSASSGYVQKTANDIGICDQDRRSQRTIRSLTVLVLFVSLDVLLIVITWAFHHSTVKEADWIRQLQYDERLRFYKVPCETLSLSNEEDVETFKVNDRYLGSYRGPDGTQICTFTNLTFVVERQTEREARLRIAKGKVQPQYMSCGDISNRPTSGTRIAFFTQITDDHTEQTAQRNDILHWDTGSNTSFVGEGIMYENGRVRVDRSQFYFVYASVTFNKSSQIHDEYGNSKRNFYIIVEISAVYQNAELTLNSLYMAEMIENCGEGVDTLYLGTQVYLQEGYLLYLAVSERSRVLYSPHSVRFGLYAT